MNVRRSHLHECTGKKRIDNWGLDESCKCKTILIVDSWWKSNSTIALWSACWRDCLWQYHAAYQDLTCWLARINPFTRPNHDKAIWIDNDMTVTKSMTFWVTVCNFFLVKRKRKICLMDKSYNKNEKKFKDFLFSFLPNFFFPTFHFQAVRIAGSTCHHCPTS